MTLTSCPVDRLSFLPLPPSSGRVQLHTRKSWRTVVQIQRFSHNVEHFWVKLWITAAESHYSCCDWWSLLPNSSCPTFVNSSHPPTHPPSPSPTASIIHTHLLRVQLPDLLMQVRLELISSKSAFYVSTSSLLFWWGSRMIMWSHGVSSTQPRGFKEHHLHPRCPSKRHDF